MTAYVVASQIREKPHEIRADAGDLEALRKGMEMSREISIAAFTQQNFDSCGIFRERLTKGCLPALTIF